MNFRYRTGTGMDRSVLTEPPDQYSPGNPTTR
jgi:hypothetical protein